MQDMGTPALRDRLFPGLTTAGRNRIALEQRTGKIQFPYLIDPNVRTPDGGPTVMFESSEIMDYLERTYGA
mgnify:FL=1